MRTLNQRLVLVNLLLAFALVAGSQSALADDAPTEPTNFGCDRDMTQAQMIARARDIRREFGIKQPSDAELLRLDQGKQSGYGCEWGTTLTRRELRWIYGQGRIADIEIARVEKFFSKHPELRDLGSMEILWTTKGSRVFVKLTKSEFHLKRSLQRAMHDRRRLIVRLKHHTNRYIHRLGNRVVHAQRSIEKLFGPINSWSISEEDERITLDVDTPTPELSAYLHERFGPLVFVEQGGPITLLSK